MGQGSLRPNKRVEGVSLGKQGSWGKGWVLKKKTPVVFVEDSKAGLPKGPMAAGAGPPKRAHRPCLGRPGSAQYNRGRGHLQPRSRASVGGQ